MGALAPMQLWIPEDDLLLKNAVEAGASLESLAKGAVRFSRQFTIQELQDRWHSILFDKDVSEKVSAQIIKVEIELSVSNNPKFSKACSCKVQEIDSAKRKSESLRSHYNAMRKRVCNEPPNYTGFNFDMSPSNCLFTENGYCDLKPSEQPFEYYFPDAEIPVDYHVQEGGDIEDDGFPEMVGFDQDSADVDGTFSAFHINDMDTGATCVDGVSHLFHTDPMDSLQCRVVDDTFCGDNLYEHVNDVPPMSDEKGTRGNTDHCYEKITATKNVLHIFDDHLSTFRDYSGVHGPEDFTGKNFRETYTETKSLSTSDLMNDGNENICSGYEGNQDIKSGSLNCSNSFPQVAYSSPLPGMPIWDIIDGISSPIMSIVGSFEDKINSSSSLPILPIEDVKSTDTPECDSDPKVTYLLDQNVVTTIGPEGDFLSVPLNLTSDGETFFADIDDKYILDKSCFESLNNFLMSSPVDVPHVDIANTSHPKAIAILDKCNVTSGGSNNAGDQVLCTQDDGTSNFGLAPNIPDISSNVSSSSKPLEGFVCCVLNTEDPEIPCNDHILPTVTAISAEMRSGSEETAVGQSLEILVDEGQANILNIAREKQDASTHPLVSSSAITQTTLLQAEKSGEESQAATMSCMDVSGNCKQELQMPCTTQDCLPSKIELDYGETEFPDPLQSISTSDQEEKYSDSEQDAPSFSDIEAMILEMDLDSDDQESPIYTREVSRYRQIDTRKAIIRLEQCAHSCMQRAISSHGAFAVFYGRYLKHYIKKTKVLLGRATMESDVDIDLRKEAQTNKISRHQAIIEMDEDGSFSIKSMGKCPILINGKEVPRGKHCSLSSGCLIELRSMAFTFEVNINSVRKYLSTVSRKSQERSSNFDWVPSEVT